VAVPARVVYPLPDSLSDTDGAIVEPLGNAVHMLGLGRYAVYRNVVVLGAGTLGLLCVAVARLAGARHVIVTDTQPHRLEVARHMGADLSFDARDEETSRRILEATEGGADLVLEAVGITATRRQAIEATAPGGTVVLLGNAEPESSLPILDVVNREITLHGSYSCTDDEFRRAIAILADGAIDTKSWVEMTTLDHGSAYFERLVQDPGNLVKVLFRLHG
jgi:L-iditol 2-dehydrogenase